MKYYEYFSKYLSDLKPDKEQQKVNCIFHDDKEASLSINLEKGFYKCFGCDKSGDIYKWVMHWENCNFKTAKRKILGRSTVPVLSESEVDESHRYLLSKPSIIKSLGATRGWTTETIIRFKLGYEEKSSRLTIPIYNEHKELINIRKHLIFGKITKGNPKSIGIKGHNSPYFFPIENLLSTNNFILLMAGEPDTILACQFDMIAGTFTGGEQSFNRDLFPLFKNKDVYMCYDKDIGGYRGLKSVGRELLKFAKEVRIVDLPFKLEGE